MRNIFKRNYLDEMQEQKLLKIESHGVWIAFSLLVISILVQVAYANYTKTGAHIEGEVITFLTLDAYILFNCIKNGIWSRSIKASNKTNAIGALIAGLIVGLLNAFTLPLETEQEIVATFIMSALFTGILTYILLQICMNITNKRRNKLDENDDEE